MPGPRPPDGDGRVNTSARQAFDLLRIVARSAVPLGVTEFARHLRLPPSTVHRILVTLEDTEFLQRHPRDSRVTLGIAAEELRHALFARYPLQTVCGPFLERLAAHSGETAALQVPLGWYSVRIIGIEGDRPIHRILHLGEAFPLHVTSGGRAILALAAEGDLTRYLSRPFLREHPAGLDADLLISELDDIRRRGYALDRRNLYPEARAIAFPVRDRDGVAVASISIVGSAAQFDPEADDGQIDVWRETVADLEAELRDQPDRHLDPFGHLDRDDIHLDVELPGTR